MIEAITYLLIGVVVVIVLGIIGVRRRQKKRMEEARIRGIKTALREQKQYEAIRKMEGREDSPYLHTDERGINKRREIRR